MAYIKSLRDVIIDTRDGHMIRVKAREVKYIPDSVLPRALEKGCFETTKEGQLIIGEDVEHSIPVDEIPVLSQEERDDPEKRQKVLVMAIARLYQENDRNKFTSNNTPKVRAVEALVAFPTTGSEVAKALEVYQAQL
jgi:hypothetical protein